MMKARKGFTLIELLIVIVIIGILAAIAIPKFSKTREKAYFKAMQSDLRNLATQQEIYYSVPANSYLYANAITALVEFSPSQGVTIVGLAGTNLGWGASSNHLALTAASQWCEVFFGTAGGFPDAVALTSGIVFCTGE